MGKLREKQSKFAKMVPLLLNYAHYLGYEITLGDVYAKSGHKKNSLHYIKLAIDKSLGTKYFFLSISGTSSSFPHFSQIIGILSGYFSRIIIDSFNLF